MYYITVKQSPIYHQMTLDEYLFPDSRKNPVVNLNTTNTRTYEVDRISDRFLRFNDFDAMIEKLAVFNRSVENLRTQKRESLYYTFHIPKKSGGLRRIDAPESELMEALRRLKVIFEQDFNALYHTSAFAYIRGRSTIDAVKRHQANKSNWFAKLDLSNFFGSTTLDFVMRQFSLVFPFCVIMQDERGRKELEKALELAFLNGVLPQGTPISPTITNIMMIPIDFKLANGFRNLDKQSFVYTRYADDFIVSSEYNFDVKSVEHFIVETLASFNAPFTLNREKTRYGSKSGRNWNLGVMLNKDNQITVGYKKKRQFQAMLSSYVMDKKNGVNWDIHDIMTMEGLRNYYRMVEGEAIDKLVEHLGEKFNVNIVHMIREDLKT